MESHRKGEATEATVIAKLKQRAIPVSTPFGDNERYDVVVETPDGRLLRVQIKTGNYSEGVLIVSGKSQHTNSQGHQYERYSGDIDYFLAYNDELEQLYWIPEGEVQTKIHLRVDAPEQIHGTINWASDYVFDDQWPPEPTDDDRLSQGSTAKKVLASLDELGVSAWYSTQDVRYPVVVERDGGELLRLRIRSVTQTDGCLQLNASDGVDRDRLDYFLAYCHELDQTYLVAATEFEQSIKLRVRDTVRGRSTINWAREYELQTRAGELT